MQCCQIHAKSFNISNKLKCYQCNIATQMYSIKTSNTSIEFATRSRVQILEIEFYGKALFCCARVRMLQRKAVAHASKKFSMSTQERNEKCGPRVGHCEQIRNKSRLSVVDHAGMPSTASERSGIAQWYMPQDESKIYEIIGIFLVFENRNVQNNPIICGGSGPRRKPQTHYEGAKIKN